MYQIAGSVLEGILKEFGLDKPRLFFTYRRKSYPRRPGWNDDVDRANGRGRESQRGLSLVRRRCGSMCAP